MLSSIFTFISLLFVIIGWIGIWLIKNLYYKTVDVSIYLIAFIKNSWFTFTHFIEIFKPILFIIAIVSFSIIFLLLTISNYFYKTKIISIKKSNYILNVEGNIVLPINTIYESSIGWVVYTKSATLENNNLIWTDFKYSINEVNIPEKTSKDNNISEKWEEIGKLVKKQIHIEHKKSEYHKKIEEIEQAGQIAATSSIYSKYLEQYEQVKLLLRKEINKGENLIQEINNTIREILISTNLSNTESYLNSIVSELLNNETLFDEHKKEIQEKYQYILNESEAYLQTREVLLTQNF
ncbi:MULTISPECIES: hypothetical protein [unclassified Tolypothrix]|uniref:hypothetical protein n=1 Tax=unclassified Tolypothrix TaxID=2649714 RepID=UPI0005EAA23E|nr:MULTISPECIES: hypothetical protein [unclassified Tolypothrix]BAY92120.1 hypothetical protein NIES3275_41520 [Microchaete diplosiphon NIES-3275]EKF04662.1 hypothetical protein FDUTEX481_00819 [Tolypothrix sp. PCC 7601]MBE9084383.1 hypothetical protein [Tolypothrix sp. LEGE 11397]UYD26102.1 hypothetical protein HGR01_33160 [Tolypothrix sp. PCC 7712]UYD31659.1 hypothetical protein HG267_21365 [Tolypothrix sp. PCC 7601]